MNYRDILAEMLKEVPELLPGGRNGELARVAERSPIFRQIVEACAMVAHEQVIRQELTTRSVLQGPPAEDAYEALIDAAQPRRPGGPH